MVARAASKRARASFLPSADSEEPSPRTYDRGLILHLFDAHLRALGVTGKFREQIMGAAKKKYGLKDAPGGIAAIQAVVAVLDGFPVERVRRGFPEGREE